MNSCVCSQAARAARARADCLAHDFAHCARAENVAAARFLEVARVGRTCYVLHEIPLLQRRSLVLVVTHRPPTVCSMHTAKVRAALHAQGVRDAVTAQAPRFQALRTVRGGQVVVGFVAVLQPLVCLPQRTRAPYL